MNASVRQSYKPNRAPTVALLSPAASGLLEEMAQKARILTRKHFGNSVFLFTPFYISNICDNRCPYCSFAKQHAIIRNHLSVDEIEKEAECIAQTGIRHILVLTGESRRASSPQYLRSAIEIIRKAFSSISIEVYALSTDEYKLLVDAGVDGLTIYQETYNRELYKKLHMGGPKEDYDFRITAPDRAAEAGVRSATVGALFGLYDWRTEAFMSGLHAYYLQCTYPSLEVSVSFPRLRPQAGEYSSEYLVNDRQFVQMLAAMRLFLPSVGITLSTRESEQFRNSVLPIGITKISGGVSTSVGGRASGHSTSQFEIADGRSVSQMKSDLLKLGFQPVMHDWNRSYLK
ncbi:MAG TPA: 2-iminoacetate synthase ThiH [Chitinispirillaceae bacterium]|nr:2-iminoacetate synthase ThiH [Chitinispirillaceae bacterium]